MAILEHRNADADANVRRARREAFEEVVEGQNLVKVACPHPGCEKKAFALAPDEERDLMVTRSAALFGDYEKVHCPEGHKVFTHYC